MRAVRGACRTNAQDKPICQGDVDHVSPPGGNVGKHHCAPTSHPGVAKREKRRGTAAVQAVEDAVHAAQSVAAAAAAAATTANASAADATAPSKQQQEQQQQQQQQQQYADKAKAWAAVGELSRRSLSMEEDAQRPHEILGLEKGARLRTSSVRTGLPALPPDKGRRRRWVTCRRTRCSVFADIAAARKTLTDPATPPTTPFIPAARGGYA